MPASHTSQTRVSPFSIHKVLYALPLCAAFLMPGISTPAKADPLVRGVQGAIGGAIIGGALKGGKGAGRGALIGAGIGIVGGAIEEENRRKYRRHHRHHRRAHRRDYVAYGPPPPPVYRSDLVYETQIELTRLGYNPGPVDGIYGRRTGEALATYQDDYGLPVTGEPSPALLDHMRRHPG